MLYSTKQGVKEDSTDNEPKHKFGEHESFQASSISVVFYHESL